MYALAFKSVYKNKESYAALGRGRITNVGDLKGMSSHAH